MGFINQLNGKELKCFIEILNEVKDIDDADELYTLLYLNELQKKISIKLSQTVDFKDFLRKNDILVTGVFWEDVISQENLNELIRKLKLKFLLNE